MRPPQAVDPVVVHRPEQGPTCPAILDPALPAMGEPLRQQIWALPPVVAPEVVDHQSVTVVGPGCQVPVAATRPSIVPAGQVGVRTQAVVGWLH